MKKRRAEMAESIVKENKTNLKALRIANFIFTVLAVAGLVASIVFFVTTVNCYNDMKAETDAGNAIGAGIGFGFGAVFYIIFAVVTMALSVIGAGLSLGKLPDRKVESVLQLVINLVALVAVVAMLVVIVILG